MAQEIVNLDEDLAEYFEFTLKGNNYRMRYPTVEETDEIRKNALNELKARDLLFKHVSPLDPKAPTIIDLHKSLPINQWNKLVKLIQEKLSE